MATDGSRPLWRFTRFIEEFRKLDPEMPSQTVHTFLLVAMRGDEGLPQKDLAALLGVEQSTVSRNVSSLDKINRHHQPGLDLVRSVEDPNERRRKVIRLTARGRLLREQLVSILEQP